MVVPSSDSMVYTVVGQTWVFDLRQRRPNVVEKPSCDYEASSSPWVMFLKHAALDIALLVVVEFVIASLVVVVLVIETNTEVVVDSPQRPKAYIVLILCVTATN